MKAKVLAILLTSLVLSACSPSAVATSAGEQPSLVQGTEPAASGNTRPLAVQNVEVAVGIGSPLPVDIVISGIWPSLCSQVAEVRSAIRDFNIDITVLASMQETCPPDQVGLSYRFAIPLNVVELPEGTYTISVNGTTTTLNIPAGLDVRTGAIFGWVWHDQCLPGPEGQPAPSAPPPGCIENFTPLGSYHGNGVRDTVSTALGINEQTIEGVTVRLFDGDCGSAALNQVAETQTIATDVSYSFTGLAPGTYCVVIDQQEDVNKSILLPGFWTYPRVTDDAITQTVTLQPQEAKYEVNFGWDYQLQ